jgi:glutamyl-tRNA synthetase
MSESAQKTITRFAPSPTGYLHVGGARTALYNYLLAKKFDGTFILRIEDTDRERSTDESIQAILDGMSWLGLSCDEGPYYQTKRYDLYGQAIDKLLAAGKAYPCFCSAEDLQVKREAAQASKVKYRYDRTCYQLSADERAKKIAADEKHVIRFLSNEDETITINDSIKGEVSVQSIELDDLILKRTDGNPTYNLTVVIDDAEMKVSHVIRGDDHLNNTFRQVQLYKALGYELPQFAHLPMILGSDKKRLSKRHGATSVMAYKELGYLPQALLNYLVRLGWGFKDEEVFSLDEMIEKFSLESCSTAPAVFNTEKLDWLNGHYIRESKADDLAPLVGEVYAKEGLTDIDNSLLLAAIPIGQQRAKTILELAAFIKLFFVTSEPDEAVIQKHLKEDTKPMLARVYEELEKSSGVDHDSVHAVFEKVMTEFDLKLGKVANPVRVAITGLKASPGAYDLIAILGKDESLKRIKEYL